MSLPFLPKLEDLGAKLAEATKHFLTNDENIFRTAQLPAMSVAPVKVQPAVRVTPTVKQPALKVTETALNKFSATHYDPRDPKQTRANNPQGVGAFGTPVKFGDVASGVRNLPAGTKIYIDQLKDVQTPYGAGIFNVNDRKNVRYDTPDKPNFDIALPVNTPNRIALQKRIGNNTFDFRIIPNINVTGASPTANSMTFGVGQGATPQQQAIAEATLRKPGEIEQIGDPLSNLAARVDPSFTISSGTPPEIAKEMLALQQAKKAGTITPEADQELSRLNEEFGMEAIGMIVPDGGKIPEKKGILDAVTPDHLFSSVTRDLYPSTAKAGKAALADLAEEVSTPLVKKYGPTTAGQIAEIGGQDFATHALINGNEDEVMKVLGTDNANLLKTKVIDFLNSAGKSRDTQEALYSMERAKRAGAVGGILEQGTGQEAFKTAKGALKGELPKGEFAPRAGGVEIAQKEVDALFDSVRTASLQPFQKITASEGLGKLLGDPYFEGAIPNNSEIKLLREIFGGDFAKAVLELQPRSGKIWDVIKEVANVPRALMASMDLSAPLRQGLVLGVERPKEWAKAFGKMFKYFGSEKYFKAAMNEIQSSPMASLREGSKLDLTDIEGALSGKEEGFMTNLAQKIPGIGRLVKASERGFVGFLNKLRVDSFDNIAKEYMAGGITPTDNPEVFTGLANFINTATGRTPLKGKLASATPFLNSVFFSPRLLASRVQMFNPQWYFSLPAPARKLAVKSMLKLVGTGIGILSLAKLNPDAEVESDPRSSDFGKIKIGNARWDVWGGFQQWFVLGARLLTGESKAAATGEIREIDPNQFPFDSRLDTTIRFGLQKLAPIPALGADLLRGQTAVGEELGLSQTVVNKLVPLYIQDIVEAIKDEESTGLGFSVGVPAFFGVGTQVFDSSGSSKPGALGLPKLPQLPKLPKLPKVAF